MSQDRETNLALFIDFDNVALGARDARQRFDITPLLQRLLEKGKIIVKKAYADWHYYKEHMSSLHEAAIELIEIPMPRISGKNSADIKLVVDAMDLCYSKDHIDTFVIVSGDSDFSPLVSKLRENNKRVIGIGVKNSSSKLLIGNCDEFIFYDDIYRQTQRVHAQPVGNLPADKRELFNFLVSTVQSLLQESRGVLYSSLIKDTMTRKQPAFTERAHGFSTFGDLLDEARQLGLLVVERDAAAGGTWVVHGVGEGDKTEAPVVVEKNGAPAGGRSSRRRRRSGRGTGSERTNGQASGADPAEGKAPSPSASKVVAEANGNVAPDPKSEAKGEAKSGRNADRQRRSRRSGRKPADLPLGEGKPTGVAATNRGDTGRNAAEQKPVAKPADAAPSTVKPATAKKATARKATAKKATAKKAAAKKTPAKKTTAKKTTAKNTAAKNTAAKNTAAKNTTTKKTAAKKTAAKKTAAQKSTTKKTSARKATAKTAGDKSGD